MGLDITAYRQVELVKLINDTDEFEEQYGDKWQEFDYIAWSGDFPDRLPPIQVKGVYRFAETFKFRAGAYSGYNRWRDLLSEMALGVSAKVVWANPEKYKTSPFFELINFSDCEGVIGTYAGQRLLAAFDSHLALASKNEVSWFIEKYNDWHKAFSFAADNGYVDFH